MNKRRIYLDNAATTKVDSEVMDVMRIYSEEKFGNPSSMHFHGQEAKQAIDDAKKVIADSIMAENDEIYFTSGGSESDNWALEIALGLRKKGHIITSKIEHHAILNKCKELKQRGFDVTYVGCDELGVTDVEEIKRAIRKDTVLISVMFANNEIGTLQPIEEIGKLAKENNILFHTDAVCAYTKVPIDVKRYNINMLSACAHKIGGPKGVGLLYVDKNVKIKPMIFGGAQQEGARAGTENVAGIVGFAKAVEIKYRNLPSVMKKQTKLREYFVNQVLTKIPYSRLNGHPRKRLPSNANFCFQFVEGTSLMVLLDVAGISCSTASACSQGKYAISHVLEAIGLPEEVAGGSIRFTFGEDTTKEDMDYVVKNLVSIVDELREKSMEYVRMMKK